MSTYLGLTSRLFRILGKEKSTRSSASRSWGRVLGWGGVSQNPLSLYSLNLFVSVCYPCPNPDTFFFTYYLQKISFQSFAEVQIRQLQRVGRRIWRIFDSLNPITVIFSRLWGRSSYVCMCQSCIFTWSPWASLYMPPQHLVWYQHMVGNKCLNEW